MPAPKQNHSSQHSTPSRGPGGRGFGGGMPSIYARGPVARPVGGSSNSGSPAQRGPSSTPQSFVSRTPVTVNILTPRRANPGGPRSTASGAPGPSSATRGYDGEDSRLQERGEGSSSGAARTSGFAGFPRPSGQGGKTFPPGYGRGKQGRGLGVGLGAIRHRGILRDNINGVTKPAIRRLARRGGVKRISGGIYEEIRGVVKKRLEDILRDCVAYCEHAKRKTVTVTDVIFALKRIGTPIYGFDKDTFDGKKRRRLLVPRR
ncbi:hypothetical protein ABW19_dt0202739 [Dactylella cylindrospora]|nr:hypothetical protein ABW19_dt0202739 [Dactylella cylindrospora]